MILECSSCQRPLVELVLANKAELRWKVKADCPYCGDSSFTKDFDGAFSYKGIEENGVPKTMVVDAISDVSDEILFKVVKV